MPRLPLVAAMLAALAWTGPAKAAAPIIPTLVVESVTVREGDAGLTAFEARVSFVAMLPGSGPYEVDVIALPSSATADDFVFTPVRIRLGYGESQVVKGFVLGDTTFEGDEAFRLHLEAPPGTYNLPNTQDGVVTIVDDDRASAPRLTLPPPSRVPEGDEGWNTIDIPVALSAPQASPVTFDYATSGGRALSDAASLDGDYRAVAGTITLAPGETVGTISVDILGDTAWERESTITVSLANVKGAIADPPSTTVTITNDDPPTTVRIDDEPAFEGNEGTSPATLVLTLSAPSSGAGRVWVTFTGSSAWAGEDFVDPGVLMLVPPAGKRSMLVPIDIIGDRTPENAEDVVVQYRGLDLGDDTLHTARLTIFDDDVFVDGGTDLPPPSDGSVISPPDGAPPPMGDGGADGRKSLPSRRGCCSVASGPDTAPSSIATLLLVAAALAARRRATPAR